MAFSSMIVTLRRSRCLKESTSLLGISDQYYRITRVIGNGFIGYLVECIAMTDERRCPFFQSHD